MPREHANLDGGHFTHLFDLKTEPVFEWLTLALGHLRRNKSMINSSTRVTMHFHYSWSFLQNRRNYIIIYNKNND